MTHEVLNTPASSRQLQDLSYQKPAFSIKVSKVKRKPGSQKYIKCIEIRGHPQRKKSQIFDSHCSYRSQAAISVPLNKQRLVSKGNRVWALLWTS